MLLQLILEQAKMYINQWGRGDLVFGFGLDDI